MAAHLHAGEVAVHAFVIGEIALGHLRQRRTLLADLGDLPHVVTATDAEVMAFVEQYRLHGRGIGWVDAHLLAAVRLTPECLLWTRDRALNLVAAALHISATE
jgi:hypothetical protein